MICTAFQSYLLTSKQEFINFQNTYHVILSSPPSKKILKSFPALKLSLREQNTFRAIISRGSYVSIINIISGEHYVAFYTAFEMQYTLLYILGNCR